MSTMDVVNKAKTILTGTNINKYEWNVIDKSQYKERVLGVFNQVSSSLETTLGPCGGPTTISTFADMHITKDGWSVIKNIYFKDKINNDICKMLLDIAAQVVIKVGDGSTSSIVAANALLKNLEELQLVSKLRSRDLENLITNCVNNLTDKIKENSTKIDKNEGTTLEEIYNLALISTNGDNAVAKLIQEIYLQTGNSTIEYLQSKTNETHSEIVEGFKSQISYLDDIYINNDERTCNIDNPVLLMFDHKIGTEHYAHFIQPAIQSALQSNRRLVVIAPYYDNFLLEQIKKVANSEFKSMGITSVVYARSSMYNNAAQTQYNDFSMMAGATMITEAFLREAYEKTEKGEPAIELADIIGEVEKISIGTKTSLIQGFYKRDENMYQLILNSATASARNIEIQNLERNIVTTEVYDSKQRVARLRGKIGIIHVGGNSTLAKVSNKDLVEDAVKACESAYNHGYNIGGNLVIPIYATELMDNTTSEEEKLIYKIFIDSFREVFKKVLKNKFNCIDDKDDDIEKIIDNCITERTCYDLTTEQYSSSIINSCLTDIEILKAATSILIMIVSSNQYIAIMPNVE